MNDLTKEQMTLLTLMYKEVLKRKKNSSLEKANYFSNSIEIKELFLPNLSISYVSDLCWQLKSKGYISCYPGDDVANDISLSDMTISYMETRFLRSIKNFVEFLLKLKP